MEFILGPMLFLIPLDYLTVIIDKVFVTLHLVYGEISFDEIFYSFFHQILIKYIQYNLGLEVTGAIKVISEEKVILFGNNPSIFKSIPVRATNYIVITSDKLFSFFSC